MAYVDGWTVQVTVKRGEGPAGECWRLEVTGHNGQVLLSRPFSYRDMPTLRSLTLAVGWMLYSVGFGPTDPLGPFQRNPEVDTAPEGWGEDDE